MSGAARRVMSDPSDRPGFYAPHIWACRHFTVAGNVPDRPAFGCGCEPRLRQLASYSIASHEPGQVAP